MVSPGNLAWRLSNNARYTAANMLLQYMRLHTLPWKVGLKGAENTAPRETGAFFLRIQKLFEQNVLQGTSSVWPGWWS